MGISAFTPRLCEVVWPPNFKVSNVKKFKMKLDPRAWLAVYSTAASAASASEDVMAAYVPMMLGHDVL